jgi:hypothetical protein
LLFDLLVDILLCLIETNKLDLLRAEHL